MIFLRFTGYNKMNKNEIIRRISDKTGLRHADAEKFLSALDEVLTDALADGEKVVFQNFGAFEVHTRAAHAGRNPKTGEPIEIPESRTAVFRAGKKLKDRIGSL